MSDQLVAETFIWQHTTLTTVKPPGGIRTHNPSRRAAADLRLRPHGHWDRLFLLCVLLSTSALTLCFVNNRIWVVWAAFKWKVYLRDQSLRRHVLGTRTRLCTFTHGALYDPSKTATTPDKALSVVVLWGKTTRQSIVNSITHVSPTWP